MFLTNIVHDEALNAMRFYENLGIYEELGTLDTWTGTAPVVTTLSADTSQRLASPLVFVERIRRSFYFFFVFFFLSCFNFFFSFLCDVAGCLT